MGVWLLVWWLLRRLRWLAHSAERVHVADCSACIVEPEWIFLKPGALQQRQVTEHQDRLSKEDGPTERGAVGGLPVRVMWAARAVKTKPLLLDALKGLP